GGQSVSSRGATYIEPGTIDVGDFVPISVWYSGGNARAPMLSKITPTSREEWLTDLRQIKDLGYNTVRTWVEWSKCEPREGHYDFRNLELLLELAEEVGLRVFIQLYLDSAPDWIGKKYPDAYFTAQNGEQMKPQSAPGYSIDHPGVREAARQFMTRAAEVASRSEAHFGWDIWSEPHLINWASAPWMSNAHFGFNPHTQARFREWLKRKYDGQIEALNASWYRTFEEWDDVEAPRLRTILSFTDYVDWRLFLYDKMKEDVRFRYDTIREVDRRGIITSHASPVSLYESPFNGRSANDDFLISQQLDYYGMSLYPKHNDPSRHYQTWQMRTLADFAYSANKLRGGFQVGELQSGFGTIGLTISDTVTADEQREWLWAVLAGGAKGVHIYTYKPMSSGYESGGYVLTNVDGTIPDRARSTGKIASVITEHGALFGNSYPIDAEVALVYNPLAQLAGGLGSNNPAPRMHTNSLIGYYRYFADHHIPMDFIHRFHLEEGQLDQYKLIIIPMSLMFTDEAAEGLRDYVARGGRVIGEARMAWNDARGFASSSLPAMGLTELFGVREAEIRKKEEPIAIRIRQGGSEFGAEALHGGDVVGAYFEEILEPLNEDVTVLATFATGAPAMTRDGYGEGEAIFVGSFLGLANQTLEGAAEANESLLDGLVSWAGVGRPIQVAGAKGRESFTARLHRREGTNEHILFLINHDEAPQNLTVELDLGYLDLNGVDRLEMTELTSGRTNVVRNSGAMLSMDVRLPRKQVEVWHLRP